MRASEHCAFDDWVKFKGQKLKTKSLIIRPMDSNITLYL